LVKFLANKKNLDLNQNCELLVYRKYYPNHWLYEAVIWVDFPEESNINNIYDFPDLLNDNSIQIFGKSIENQSNKQYSKIANLLNELGTEYEHAKFNILSQSQVRRYRIIPDDERINQDSKFKKASLSTEWMVIFQNIHSYIFHRNNYYL